MFFENITNIDSCVVVFIIRSSLKYVFWMLYVYRNSSCQCRCRRYRNHNSSRRRSRVVAPGWRETVWCSRFIVSFGLTVVRWTQCRFYIRPCFVLYTNLDSCVFRFGFFFVLIGASFTLPVPHDAWDHWVPGITAGNVVDILPRRQAFEGCTLSRIQWAETLDFFAALVRLVFFRCSGCAWACEGITK